MSIAMINPQPPQPKENLIVTDRLFYDTISCKYGRFKQPRLKFPSLIFLFSPQLQFPILQYLLVKNMNILPGNKIGRNYHLHQHQHLDFVIHLFLRLSHLSPNLAVPAPAASAAVEMIGNQTALTFTGRNEIQFHSLPWKPQPAPLYFNRGVFERTNTSNLNMIIAAIQKSVKEIHPSNTHPPIYTHIHTQTSTPAGRMKISRLMLLMPEAAMLFPRLMTSHFYHRELMAHMFPGAANIDSIYLEPKTAAGKQPTMPGPAGPGSRYYYQWFLQDRKTSDMFINANQRLLKKINLRHPDKIEMSHLTASILPRLITSHFYHRELMAHMFPGAANIDGNYRELKSAAGKQPTMPGPAVPGSQYQYQWFLQDRKTYDMFINANQRLLKKINFHLPGEIEMGHPTADILPGLMTTDFYHPELKAQPYLGSWKIDGIYRESKAAAGKQPTMPGPVVPGFQHLYQWFLQDEKTSDVFINANQKLLKESNLLFPRKIEMSQTTTGILPRLKTTRFYHPVHTEHGFPGSSDIVGIYRESKPAAGSQPSKPTQPGPGVGQSSKQPESAVPTDTSLFDTVVTKRLLTPLHYFTNILKKHAKGTSFGDDAPKERHQADREGVGGATPPLPADLHHFSPLNRVESDLKEAGTIKAVTAVDKNPEAAAGFKEKSNIAGPGFTQNTTIDLNQLTDRVYRILERKIRTEKERRGW